MLLLCGVKYKNIIITLLYLVRILVFFSGLLENLVSAFTWAALETINLATF